MTFWAKVKANLLAGRIRMLFVADRIPPELRKVVEFLNAQMRPAEVLAIELRQYQGEGLRALAPILLGQTQEAIDQKSGSPSPKPRRQWDEAQIVEALTARYEPGVSAAAKALIDWMNANADRVSFNDAPNVGSVGPEFMIGGEPCQPMRFWTDGSAAISFVQLMWTPAFSAPAARQELMDRLNAMPNVAMRADALEKQGFFRLAALAGDQGAAFLKAMDWMVGRLREAPTTVA